MVAGGKAPADTREYEAYAKSTDTFGRVMCNSRNHFMVVDGPVQNGCPGEAITPSEMFLALVATCGVELGQVLAARQGLPLQSIEVGIYGVMDRSNPVRPDFTLFS